MAKARGAYQEASQNLSLALSLMQVSDEDRRWQILLDLDELWGILSLQEERREIIQQIMEIALTTDDDNRIAEAYYHEASYESMRGQFGLELESHMKSLAAAQRSGNRRIEALVYGMLTICYSNLGELQKAERSAENALTCARKLADEGILVRNLNNVAVFYQNSGDHARAIRILQEHVSINQCQSNQFGEALGLLNLGFSYISLGQFLLAVESLLRSIDILEEMEARRMLSYGHLNLGLCRLRTGEEQAAIHEFEKALSNLKSAGDSFGIAASSAYLGLALEASGDFLEAESHFEEREKPLSRIGDSSASRWT